MIARIDEARPAVVVALLALLQAAVFVPMSLLRLVDGDEGTYLMVSRLVVEGRQLYHDFYYPQMYLLPYVYGVWMKLTTFSWYGARLLSATFAVALGLLVHRAVARATGRQSWGAGSAVLFALSSLAFGWYPLVKTFALPTLALFGAYAAASTTGRWRWIASGFLVGLAVACRVYLVAVAPLFLLEIHLTQRDLRVPVRLVEAARFAIGFLVALLPAAFFFFSDPQAFTFDIVGSQMIRTGYGSVSWWDQKTFAAQSLMALGLGEGLTSLQFILLLLLNVASWVSSALSRERPSLASSLALVLTLVSFVPTPVYSQYFCIPLPFLLVNAVVWCAALVRESPAPRLRHLVASLAAVYSLVAPIDLRRYTASAHLPGIGGGDPEAWRISTIRAVGRAIDRAVPPDRPVAAGFWPGYFVETRAAILPGLENHFALMFSQRVPPRDALRFRLMSYPLLTSVLQRHAVEVVVLGNWANWSIDRDRVRRVILEARYALKERIGDAEIYTLRP